MKFLLTLSVIALCAADLRPAAQPKKAWTVQQRRGRGAVPFVTDGPNGNAKAFYMEPSAFNYNGLDNQRKNAYDNFLRSNIDNEQDRRNFNNEDGEDHLPFRTMNTGGVDTVAANDIQRKLPAADGFITANVGVPSLFPLRWNNPHAAEREVNVWINSAGQGDPTGKTAPVVVPIRKPVCSGEGHQDNTFAFTIPADFMQLPTKVPGFTGCNVVGDCTLQMYAHSVESRQYSHGVPIIVPGTYATTGLATTANAILPAGVDNGLNLAPLRDLCLNSNDPAAEITSAIPQAARLISDVCNHAYQNSDFSAYSGQQPAAISKNLQSSAIIKQVAANRGELGKRLFKQENAAGANLAKQVLKASGKLIKKYEGVTNRIIGRLMDKEDVNQANVANTAQQSSKCFRCVEVGATNPRRLKTNTYVPSFQIPAALVAQAKALITDDKYKHVINEAGQLQIYATVVRDMTPQYVALGKLGVGYQPACMKDTVTTLASETQHKKRNAQGRTDGGNYAATLAKQLVEPQKLFVDALAMQWSPSGLYVESPEEKQSSDEFAGAFAQAFVVAGPEGDVEPPPTGADDQGVAYIDGVQQFNFDGQFGDSDCDSGEIFENMTDEQIDAYVCSTPARLFTPTASPIETTDGGPVNVVGSSGSSIKASGLIFAGVVATVALLF